MCAAGSLSLPLGACFWWQSPHRCSELSLFCGARRSDAFRMSWPPWHEAQVGASGSLRSSAARCAPPSYARAAFSWHAVAHVARFRLAA